MTESFELQNSFLIGVCVFSNCKSLWAIEKYFFFEMASLGVYRSDFGLVS